MIEQSAKAIVLGLFFGDVFGQLSENLFSEQLPQNIHIYKTPNPAILDAFNELENSSRHNRMLDSTNLVLACLLGMHPNFKISGNQVANPAFATITHLSYLATTETPIEAYMQHVWDTCSGQDETFDMTVRKIGHVLGWGSTRHAMRHLSESGDNAALVTLVMYCIMRYPDNLEQALQLSLAAPIDHHMVCILTSALLTLHLGSSAIPQVWQQKIEAENDIQQYVTLLMSKYKV